MYRDTTNVEPEMYNCTSNNCSQWNSNEKLKEKFGNCTGKTFDRFTTKDSYTWNITHNTESTAVWSLKRERWGTPLVQEKYREERARDMRQTYRIIIIIIIITLGNPCNGRLFCNHSFPGLNIVWSNSILNETTRKNNNNNNSNNNNTMIISRVLI